jgi:hypothetical protein
MRPPLRGHSIVDADGLCVFELWLCIDSQGRKKVEAEEIESPLSASLGRPESRPSFQFDAGLTWETRTDWMDVQDVGVWSSSDGVS